MQNQKLCLKWNNHMSNMLSLLGSFQQKDMLVDVTISCQGQNIKAHKVILSACSQYFQNIFMENPCQHPIIIINGMKFEDVSAILNFMYKGEVNVSQDGLSSFLQAAEALKVKGLAEVCGEKKGTNSITQEVQQSEVNRPQRTDTPPRKRPRNRKRSLSDSNRSDDEGLTRKHREPSSPEVHELSGDESFTGDNSSNGPPFNSVPRVPHNVYSHSRSHQSSNIADEDEEYDVESNKMLDTSDSNQVSMNNNADNNLRIERIMGNTEIESSSLQEPESPPDIKPIISYGESSAGTSESGAMMLYNEQSQPGPSNAQDGSLLHDNSHTQAFQTNVMSLLKNIISEQKKIRNIVDLLTPSSKTLPDDCPQFPINSSDDMTLFNKYLENKNNFSRICHFYQSVGGADTSSTVRRILQSIITNTLSLKYNWKGTGGEKEAFSQYKQIIQMISFSVRNNPVCQTATDHEIESCIKKWLVHAKDREINRLNKLSMKDKECTRSNKP